MKLFQDPVKVARFCVILLALSMGGFMTFDGIHGFVTGRYFTTDGETYGPWVHVVGWIGLVPDSHLMRAIFVAFGLAWLAALGAYLRGTDVWLRRMSLLSLWYWSVGTLHCVLVLGLLGRPPRVRRQRVPRNTEEQG